MLFLVYTFKVFVIFLVSGFFPHLSCCNLFVYIAERQINTLLVVSAVCVASFLLSRLERCFCVNYWAVAQLLGKLPANDPTRVVQSNVTVDEVNSKCYAGITSTAKKTVQQVPDYW